MRFRLIHGSLRAIQHYLAGFFILLAIWYGLLITAMLDNPHQIASFGLPLTDIAKPNIEIESHLIHTPNEVLTFENDGYFILYPSPSPTNDVDVKITAVDTNQTIATDTSISLGTTRNVRNERGLSTYEVIIPAWTFFIPQAGNYEIAITNTDPNSQLLNISTKISQDVRRQSFLYITIVSIICFAFVVGIGTTIYAIRHRKHFAELEENYQKGRNRWDELNK